MLSHSDRCDTYDEFRDEVDIIAKAMAAQFLSSSPMDLGAFNSNGGGKDACTLCGNQGHKAADCWGAESKGGGGAGGGPLKCIKCHKPSHAATDCCSGEGSGKGKGKGDG